MLLHDAFQSYLLELMERQSSASHLQTVKIRVGRFIRGRETQSISDITRLDLASFFLSLKESGLADATLAGYTSSHRAFWRFCYKRGYTKELLSDKLKKYSFKPEKRVPADRNDLKTVIANLFAFASHRGNKPNDVRDALFVSFIVDAGVRRNAVWRLCHSQVDEALERPLQAANGRFSYRVVVHDKGKMSSLNFFQETAQLYKLYDEVRPVYKGTDRIFINVRTGEPLQPGSVGRAFDRVCEFSGVPVFRAHSVRKRNVIDILDSSGNPKIAQAYAGHSDIRVTLDHYTYLHVEQVRDVSAELADNRRSDYENLANFFGVKKE